MIDYLIVSPQSGQIMEYMWKRDELQTIKEVLQQDFKAANYNIFLVKVLKYFADLHLNNFFHGNIKPDKIFLSNGVI